MMLGVMYSYNPMNMAFNHGRFYFWRVPDNRRILNRYCVCTGFDATVLLSSSCQGCDLSRFVCKDSCSYSIATVVAHQNQTVENVVRNQACLLGTLALCVLLTMWNDDEASA